MLLLSVAAVAKGLRHQLYLHEHYGSFFATILLAKFLNLFCDSIVNLTGKDSLTDLCAKGDF